MTNSLDIRKHIEAIFHVTSESQFEDLALKNFWFQYQNVSIYKQYADLVNKNHPNSLKEIPFLPIDFFKYHEIRSHFQEVETLFKSSGTTGQIRSTHFLESSSIYRQSFENSYRLFIGNPEEQIIIALLPNYVEQQFSSLVYMVETLVEISNNSLSGFYLYDTKRLKEVYESALLQQKEVVLFGVTYALLDLVDDGLRFPNIKVIETGGMKGRRKEISKPELHQILKDKLQVSEIYSEYGMCELLSQAYSKDIVFSSPNWMKILIRDKNDPFSFADDGKSGGINVVDLANLFSCSFIQTQDLGRVINENFEILGRLDNSELRGCNLMLDINSY